MDKQSPNILIVQTTSGSKFSVGVALNSQRARAAGLAFNFEINDDNEIPEWLELIPAGAFKGHDGREWLNDKPQAIIDDVLKKGVDIPVDIEHSTEILSPAGMPSPAVGRIKPVAGNFEIREGAIFARVKWNESGKKAIGQEEYFHYSPAFPYELETNRVVGIKSIGLTNNPNLTLTALNNEETPPMDLKAILAALGLPEDGTFQDAIAAINTLKTEKGIAQNSADNPPLDKFVPRADYDVALNRAETAETYLAEANKVTLEASINSELDAAQQAGKITPATRDYHFAQCSQEGGLERFKAFVKASPSVAAGDSGLDTKPPADKDHPTALNAEEKQTAKLLGMSHEDFAAAKKESA